MQGREDAGRPASCWVCVRVMCVGWIGARGTASREVHEVCIGWVEVT